LHGHFPPREFAMRLVQLGKEYNTALLAVERNNHGHAVLAWLQDLGYPQIFKQGGADGWLTTSASRPVMIENLLSVLLEEPLVFRSVRLLNEFRTFVRCGDGTARATSGTHDDCVMAMAVAWAARKADVGNWELPGGWKDFGRN
jgi:hypothetical protein